MKKKISRREKIKLGIRKKIRGTAERPRLSVFRSNRKIYAQLIDDDKRETLCAVAVIAKSGDGTTSSTKIEQAREVGKQIATQFIGEEKALKKIVFDRSGYLYHGRVKALAEGAREGVWFFNQRNICL